MHTITTYNLQSKLQLVLIVNDHLQAEKTSYSTRNKLYQSHFSSVHSYTCYAERKFRKCQHSVIIWIICPYITLRLLEFCNERLKISVTF
jgi:hypothetical protein